MGCAGVIVNGVAVGPGGLGVGAVFTAGSADLASTKSIEFARALLPYVATGFSIDAYAAGAQFNREYGSKVESCR